MRTVNLGNFGPKNPLILVNFKNFEETTGKNALKLALELEKSMSDTGVQIGVSVQPFFGAELVAKTDLLVLGQHLDCVEYGSSTGAILPEALKSIGGWGSLINHSEKRVGMEVVEKTVLRCREVGLKSVVCVESVEEAAVAAEFGPDFIAIEPPELIGGDVSVSTAQPELISEAVKAVKNVPLLVGAGIKDGNDLKIALELGAVGILVASGVCKAKNPYDVIMDFAKSIG